MFREIFDCFKLINVDKQCRAVVISGSGKSFSSGLDFDDVVSLVRHAASSSDDVARKAKLIRNMLKLLQKSFNMMAITPKPVICSVHGHCIGTAINLVCAVDIRYCSSDAIFSIREVQMGEAADLGVLQCLPKIAGNDSLIRELAFTGRNFTAQEAKEMKLISPDGVFPDRGSSLNAAIDLAIEIANKSPVAAQGAKNALNYSMDHQVRDGLDYMANLNMLLVQSEDLVKGIKATTSKGGVPVYNDL